MAPESINFRRFTGLSDVWMFGGSLRQPHSLIPPPHHTLTTTTSHPHHNHITPSPHPHHSTPSPHHTLTTSHPNHITPSPHHTLTTSHPHHFTHSLHHCYHHLTLTPHPSQTQGSAAGKFSCGGSSRLWGSKMTRSSVKLSWGSDCLCRLAAPPFFLVS